MYVTHQAVDAHPTGLTGLFGSERVHEESQACADLCVAWYSALQAPDVSGKAYFVDDGEHRDRYSRSATLVKVVSGFSRRLGLTGHITEMEADPSPWKMRGDRGGWTGEIGGMYLLPGYLSR